MSEIEKCTLNALHTACKYPVKMAIHILKRFRMVKFHLKDDKITTLTLYNLSDNF